MRRLHKTASPGAVAPAHIVCLPGAYHGANDFLAAGFDAVVCTRKLDIDLSFIDIEMRYLGDRLPLELLRSEIIAPARAAGCRSLWLAGISLGGYIALDYAALYPGEIDGLCLLAPYLGNRLLTGEIAGAGGLAKWQPGASADCDEERRIWRFLQELATGLSGAPALFLGFGREDRFAAAHGLLAEELGPATVCAIRGGHDWPTWKTLWESFLTARFP